jgi:acetyltransferase-like isoleucine patch superfamily enzyme
LIAANCTLAPVNHEFSSRDKKIIEQRFQPSRGGILIEDDVWIGANSVVLDGAIIRKGCVIGAGSVIFGETEEYGVYVGIPARKVKERR